jgi:hypothetical protein
MLYEQTWKYEKIRWWCPFVNQDEEAIGLTGQQRRSHTSSAFAVWRYAPPRETLDYIDPFFDPGRKNTVPFLRQSISDGKLIAPAQIFLSSADEAGFFPDEPYSSDRKFLLSRPDDLTVDKKMKLVRSHEGRHRLWVAAELGETIVPVLLWVPYMNQDDRFTIRDLHKRVEELEEDLESVR